MTRSTRTGVLLAFLAAVPQVARAQEAETEAPRPRRIVEEIRVGGRVQTQFNTTTVDGEPDSELYIRRARLELAVKVNDFLSGALQPEVAGNRLQFKDAYVKLSFSPGLQLLAGKAYKPFSLLEQTSSKRILPVERGADIRGISPLDEYEIIHGLEYSDRDVGLQLMGTPKGAPLGFSYAAGVFRGPLDRSDGGGESYQFAARGTVRPAEKLRLGVGWSSRDFAPDSSEEGGSLDLERGNAFEVDVEYGAFEPGFHLLGEVAFGDYDPFTDRRFVGAQTWLGYRTRPLSRIVTGLEPVVRASWGSVDRHPGVDLGSMNDGTLLTPGVNIYFGPLNRVMVNYDFWRSRGGGSQGSFKVQVQTAF